MGRSDDDGSGPCPECGAPRRSFVFSDPKIARLTRERDEARAEVERMRTEVDGWGAFAVEQQVEVERLRAGMRRIIDYYGHGSGVRDLRALLEGGDDGR